VDSEPGAGTTFSVFLPLCDEAAGRRTTGPQAVQPVANSELA